MRKRQKRKLWKKQVYDDKGRIMRHPDVCPRCGCEIVYHGRFASKYGEYTCDDCEWFHVLTAEELEADMNRPRRCM